MKKFFSIFLLFILGWGFPSNISAEGTIEHVYLAGFQEKEIKSEAGRNIYINIWYPTESTKPPITINENLIFYGFKAIPDAPLLTKKEQPLVILSHGLNGNNFNQSWLAVELAKKGFIVVAPNHPGTTSLDSNSDETAKLWERTHDISRVIDYLLNDSLWKDHIDQTEISVIGHSLGGATAVFLAGGRFSPDRFEEFCKLNPNQVGNIWYEKYQIGKKVEDKELLSKSWKDTRVNKVILLDPGLSKGFDPANLAVIDVPILILGAGAESKKMPLDDESRYLAKKLPKKQTLYIEVGDASHFSFFSLMKPEAADLLKEVSPGDEIITFDGNGRSRKELHKEFNRLISNFLLSDI